MWARSNFSIRCMAFLASFAGSQVFGFVFVRASARSRRSGRSFRVTSAAARSRQSRIASWSPDSRTSGTASPRKTRVRKELEFEAISMGDFVLAGGELPALAIVEAVARLVPGVLGDERSA